MIVESYVREPGAERRLLGRYTTTRKELSEKEARGILQTEWEYDL